MKTICQIAVLMLLAGFIFIAAPLCRAQSPFDGTWRSNIDNVTPPNKPLAWVLQDGILKCSNCKVAVKADGTDQPVPNQQFDTINVREVSPTSVVIIRKKNGKTLSEVDRTVSADGNTLTQKTVSRPPNSPEPVIVEVTSKRVGPAPPGANKTSGTWQRATRQDSENSLLSTYKSTADGFDVSDPLGHSFSARFDGRDYPVRGMIGNVTVSLKHMDDHTIEMKFKNEGKAYLISTLAVSNDGKEITEVDKNPETGVTITYTNDKQ